MFNKDAEKTPFHTPKPEQIPKGYTRTGTTAAGYLVCCKVEDFVRFTAGTNTDHLGFALMGGSLVRLDDYHKLPLAGNTP